jgi:DNA-binding GntR family transcriptional regulator
MWYGVMADTRVTKKANSIAEKAYKLLKDMILCGEICQGEILSILALSEKLGIGRTPMTTACHRLEYDGFVRVIPKQGVWVSSPSLNGALEIYECRATIEIFFARKAMPVIDKSDLRALAASIERQETYGVKNDYANYMKEDAFFHGCFMQKYKNNTMLEMYKSLTNKIRFYGVQNISNDKRIKSAIQEHRRIVDFFSEKDETGLVRALEQHIMHGYLQLMGIYTIL